MGIPAHESIRRTCHKCRFDYCSEEPNFKVRNLEVYYGGQGAAIRFDNCRRFSTDNLVARNMRYVLGANYAFTGNTTNGSPTIANVANTGVFATDHPTGPITLTGPGIPAGTTVIGRGSNYITISTNATVTNPNVSLTAGIPSVDNDVIDFINYSSCGDFTAINNVSRDFSASNGGSETTRYCRGVIVGQCVGFEFIGGLVDKVDQGWDFSGGPVTLAFTGNTTNGSTTISNIADASSLLVGASISGAGIPASTTISTIASATSITISLAATATATGVSLTSQGVGNNGGSISAARAENCETYGFKFANVQNRIIGNGLITQNTGLAGFVASPNSSSLASQQTQDIRLSDCMAINPGGSSAGGSGPDNWVGFQIMGASGTSLPVGIVLNDCFAIDNRGAFAKMRYGFRNEVANPTVGSSTVKPSIAVNCRSFGHTISTFFQFFDSSYTQTISSDTINIENFPDDATIILSGEGGATDNLATITSNQKEGSVIKLCRSAQEIVLKHGLGNLKLLYGRDRKMDDGNSVVVLIKRASLWVESGWDAPTPVFASTGADFIDDVTITKTSSGAKSQPLQILNSSTSTGTAVEFVMAPSAAGASRSMTLRAVNNGSNQIDGYLALSNANLPVDILKFGYDQSFDILLGTLKIGGNTVISNSRAATFSNLTVGGITFSAAGLALMDDASASAQRTTLGLGTASVANTGTSGGTVPLLNTANRFSDTQTIVKTNAGSATTALVLQNSDGTATIGTAAQLLLTPYDDISRSASIRAEQTVTGGNAIKLVFQTTNGGSTYDALTLSPTGDTLLGTTKVFDRNLNVIGQETVSSDVNYTVAWYTDRKYQKHTGTLTANRTVTLSTTGAIPGATFRFTRTGSGAFSLSIGGLKSLATNTWCEVTFDGSAWYLSAYGAL